MHKIAGSDIADNWYVPWPPQSGRRENEDIELGRVQTYVYKKKSAKCKGGGGGGGE